MCARIRGIWAKWAEILPVRGKSGKSMHRCVAAVGQAGDAPERIEAGVFLAAVPRSHLARGSDEPVLNRAHRARIGFQLAQSGRQRVDGVLGSFG